MTSDEVSRRLDAAIPVKRQFALPRLPHTNLTFRLCVLVLIAVFPAIAIQGYNEYKLRKAREADIRQQVVQITRQFGEEIGELREGARQLLLALAQLPAVRLRDADSCSDHFTALKSQYENYSLLAAADTQGRIFCSSAPTTSWSVADQPFFRRAMTRDGLAVGNYWGDPATGQKMIHFAVRFGDGDGRTAGVVFAGLDLGWLSEHLKERGLSPTSSILIADREGNIIARLPNPETLVGKNMRKSHEMGLPRVAKSLGLIDRCLAQLALGSYWGLSATQIGARLRDTYMRARGRSPVGEYGALAYSGKIPVP